MTAFAKGHKVAGGVLVLRCILELEPMVYLSRQLASAVNAQGFVAQVAHSELTPGVIVPAFVA